MPNILEISKLLDELLYVAILEGKSADPRYGADEVLNLVRGSAEYNNLVDTLTGAKK